MGGPNWNGYGTAPYEVQEAYYQGRTAKPYETPPQVQARGGYHLGAGVDNHANTVVNNLPGVQKQKFEDLGNKIVAIAQTVGWLPGDKPSKTNVATVTDRKKELLTRMYDFSVTVYPSLPGMGNVGMGNATAAGRALQYSARQHLYGIHVNMEQIQEFGKKYQQDLLVQSAKELMGKLLLEKPPPVRKTANWLNGTWPRKYIEQMPIIRYVMKYVSAKLKPTSVFPFKFAVNRTLPDYHHIVLPPTSSFPQQSLEKALFPTYGPGRTKHGPWTSAEKTQELETMLARVDDQIKLVKALEASLIWSSSPTDIGFITTYDTGRLIRKKNAILSLFSHQLGDNAPTTVRVHPSILHLQNTQPMPPKLKTVQAAPSLDNNGAFPSLGMKPEGKKKKK